MKKKILTLALTVIMLCAMALPAQAARTGAVTSTQLSAAQKNETDRVTAGLSSIGLGVVIIIGAYFYSKNKPNE